MSEREIATLAAERVALLKRKYEGISAAEDDARFETLTQRLRVLSPRVTPEEIDGLSTIVESVDNRFKTCTACQQKLFGNRFRKLSDRPVVRHDVCMSCERAAAPPPANISGPTGENLAEKVRARRDERDDKTAAREIRLERKRRARTRVKAKEKERKAALQDNEAAKELARRELARRSLLQYILQFNSDYLPGWVHEDICRRLERFLDDVRAGKGPRLMLFVPPRHGKSKIASEEFPSWALGKYPDLEFIACSYGITLPLDFSRKVRGRIRDEQYQQIFERTRIDPEHQNVEGWTTTSGGGYRPAGVGSGITGKGAGVLLVDDPFKDAEEADSETARQGVWNWWGSTAYTRLSPSSGALVIQTRWDDDDLAGRLIELMRAALKEIEEVCEAMTAEGTPTEAIEAYRAEELETVDRWEIISYPAIAEQDEYLTEDHRVVHLPQPSARLLRKKGEALHPARYPLSRLRKIKRALQPRHWSALYQQNPVPDEGSFFTKSMLHYAPTPDWRELPILIAGDLAIGKKETNDWTVLGVGCVDYDNRLHLIEVVRGRMDTFEIVEAILNLYARYKPTSQSVTIGIERGQLQMAIWPVLEKRMQERKLFPSFDMELKPVTDKLVRARPLQGLMQHGQVCFAPGQPWAEQVIHELLRFPGGVFDDCVDMMAWMARMRSRVFAPKRKTPKRLKSWREKLNQYVKNQAGSGSAMAA